MRLYEYTIYSVKRHPMGRLFKHYLSTPLVYCCAECGTHLTKEEDIVSRQFNGAFGKAFLVYQIINIVESDSEERRMSTGLHLVKDVFCVDCQAKIGWKYEKAYEQSQRYKEGLFLLEVNQTKMM